MQLELGKVYRSRRGEEWKIISILKGSNYKDYPYLAIKKGDTDYETFAKNGGVYLDHLDNLVETIGDDFTNDVKFKKGDIVKLKDSENFFKKYPPFHPIVRYSNFKKFEICAVLELFGFIYISPLNDSKSDDFLKVDSDEIELCVEEESRDSEEKVTLKKGPRTFNFKAKLAEFDSDIGSLTFKKSYPLCNALGKSTSLFRTLDTPDECISRICGVAKITKWEVTMREILDD